MTDGLYLVIDGSYRPVTVELLAGWIATERWEPTEMDREIAEQILQRVEEEGRDAA